MGQPGRHPFLSLRLCSTSDERQSEGERTAQGGCSVCIWLGRFHRMLSSPSEAPEEVVAPRRRVGIFFLCIRLWPLAKLGSWQRISEPPGRCRGQRREGPGAQPPALFKLLAMGVGSLCRCGPRSLPGCERRCLGPGARSPRPAAVGRPRGARALCKCMDAPPTGARCPSATQGPGEGACGAMAASSRGGFKMS